MQTNCVMTRIARLSVAVMVVSLSSAFVCAQSKCLSSDEAKAMLARVNSHQQVNFNKQLQDELLKVTGKTEKMIYSGIGESLSDEALRKRIDDTRGQNNLRLCQILKEFGWPSSALVGKDGVVATLYLVRNSREADLQVDLLPVIVAAVKNGEVAKPELADLVDRMRVDARVKQLFGTQVTLTNGFLVLAPIEAEAQVDDRRRQFGLPPLAEHLRELERNYQTPLIRAVAPEQPLAEPLQRSINRTITSELDAPTVDEDDVIRVDTNLVNLNVSVFNNKVKSYVGTLEKGDFTVFENGREEAISYFAATDVPFDLVLLIDLSGSTAGKRDLIRKTTQRFISAARPADRLAIVTFTDMTNIVCEFTTDRAKLLESANRIEGGGGTHFWDALKYTLDQVVGKKTPDRRRAIVIMSDGVENALSYGGWFLGGSYGSDISFADLLETVRKNDEIIIPIYLDTESELHYSSVSSKRMYQNARNTLALLAQESGGFYYRARKIEDLNGVYDQVINDLGKVYSLGYKPTNEKRDGSWRRVEIQLTSRPDLTARSRPGYYAN
jgi:VWFA-related protein